MTNIKYFIKLFTFWLFYFFIDRLLFIGFYLEEFSGLTYNELLTIIPKSLKLDLSFIAYLSTIITLLLFINSISVNQILNRIINKVVLLINIFFILITTLIIGGEIALYEEWSTKLNFTAIRHFENPSEVFLTATPKHYMIILCATIIGLVMIKLYKDSVHQHFLSSRNNIVIKIIKLPIFLGVLLLIIRGGWGDVPLNTSDAYFSKHIILNDVTVNPNWNVLQSIIKSKNSFKGNPYKKYTDLESETFNQRIRAQENSESFTLLKTKEPNIVFVILESWSADNIETLGGLPGITPHFKKLEKDGLLFTDFYSNGWTSDQGISSIFSSFPVFPYVAIINEIDKSRKLPCLNKSLKNYHSSFFYGGQLTFGNIKSYLISHGFDLVKDQQNYKDLSSGRLGVHDEHMFTQFKNELSKLPEPFISSLFTLSSHAPYDFPGERKLSFNSKSDKYINSVAYTDKHFGAFMESVKDEDWYQNTLFIIVADHSHNSPRKWRVAQKERFKIPMLWYGEVLKEAYQGSTHSQMGSHIDINKSILSQLQIDGSNYEWGSDLFNKSIRPAIPYAFHRGYGIIRPNGYYAFSEDYQKILEYHVADSLEEKSLQKDAELYFQSAFKHYMDL